MRTYTIPPLQLNLFFSLNFKICFRKIKRILIQRSSRLNVPRTDQYSILEQNACVRMGVSIPSF